MRLSKSVVGEKEKAAVGEVITRGYLGMGKEVQAFENELLQFLGGEASGVEVACVNTGTSALHLAAQAIGLGAGDEVLMPSLTFVASYQAIAATGAKPVSCDVRDDNGLLDLTDAERRLTAKTRAVFYVHYASEPGDLDSLYAFAAKHRLRVIEDAAHSFGCAHGNRPIGTLGDVVCFSFDGIKNITSGEGGAIVSKDRAVMAAVKDARLLGVQKDTEKRFSGARSWDFDVTHQGWRYHMSDLMAAIGRVQLARFPLEFKPQRIALATRYRERLAGVAGVRLFSQGEGERVCHILPIRILAGKRDAVRTRLGDEKIESGVHYKPNHLLTYFSNGGESLPVTEKIYSEILTLPLHPELSLADVDRVVEIVKSTVH